MKEYPQLIYFLSETHFFSKDQSLLVVNMVGSLTKKNISIFRQCQEQVSLSKAKWIVLNFRDVPEKFDVEFLPMLDEFRAMTLKLAAQIRFSGLHPRLKEALLEKKLVHPEELTNSLAEALQTFPINLAAA